MKLVCKLMFALMFVIIALLAFDSYLSVRREQELFLSDMKHDALLLGHTLAASVEDIWQTNGAAHILKMIEETNKAEKYIDSHARVYKEQRHQDARFDWSISAGWQSSYYDT